MGKELVIASNRHETKVAVFEDDQLVEVCFQRANEYSLAGSIHKGRVTRVLPGMQSAFVNIGLERDAFLYVSDFFEDNEEYDKIAGVAEEKALKADRAPERIVERAPEPRPAEPVAVAPPPAPPPPPERPAATLERSDEGDRRGRRSRRRRTRGRGFPDAKYASVREEQPQETEVVAAAEPEPAPAPVAEGSEFSVLPGESLAKYTRGNGTGSGEGEAGVVEWQAEPPAPRAQTAAVEEAVSGAEIPERQAEPPAPPQTAVVEEAVSGAETPERQAEPPAPRAQTAVVEEAASGEEMPEWQAEAPAPPETAAPERQAEAPAPPQFEPELAAEAVPEQVTELPEGAIPEQPEAVEDAAAPEAEEEAASEAAPGVEEVEPARMPVSLTATLREQGYRYMHRVSRRMRRKMRNAGLPEAAPEERTGTVEAPEEAPAPKTNDRPPLRTEKAPLPSIAELLREGQEILVQIAKEPLGQKGARITSHIALPGRYVVYMPTVEHMGVSRKIESDEERLRLKRILQTHRAGMPGGFIVRTAGEGKPEDEIAADMRFLFNMWLDIRQKAEARKAPALLHHDLDLVHRILRDQMTDTFKTIWVDNEEVYESVLRFVERFQPGLVSRVKLYTRDTPIFDAFNISSELEKALRPKVWLKSGGYIVINQTEALVAVDVNTGKFVGKSNRLEDTIVKTNTEAVKEIVRQIRLRDLGGIIVVDFIDMDERKNRQKVMQALEEAMRSDRAPNKILQFNDFGLVAITRKRVKQSLERTLCSPCPYCEGAGYVKSVDTVVAEILQEAQKIAKVIEGEDVTLRVNPEVAKVLKSSSNTYLEELEEILGRPVIVHSDAQLQQEKFDLV
jgi:ribonuclease G